MKRFLNLAVSAALGLMPVEPLLALPVPGNAPGALGDMPAGAASLPGDRLPPFLMLDAAGRLKPIPSVAELEAMVSKAHEHVGPESTAIGPDLEMSMTIAQAAVKACLNDGYQVGVAVVDTVGDARAELTADGSDGSHVFVAHRKALTALAYEMPNSVSVPQILQGKLPMDRVTPAMFVMPGALPIMKNGKIIGAVGVSGAAGVPPGLHDEACARAGLKAVAARLK